MTALAYFTLGASLCITLIQIKSVGRDWLAAAARPTDRPQDGKGKCAVLKHGNARRGRSWLKSSSASWSGVVPLQSMTPDKSRRARSAPLRIVKLFSGRPPRVKNASAQALAQFRDSQEPC